MTILILANYDVGLFQFRKELIKELLLKHEVIISLPYGDLVDPLTKMGCKFIDTPFERRGINPLRDFGLLIKYYKIIKSQKPELVITYTIKPNVYGGIICRMKKIPYAINITGLGTAFQKRGFLRKLVTMMYKISSKNAKIVYFENEENCQIFINEKIVDKDQTCLLNGAGVNLDHYQISEYPIDCSSTRFLFIGRLMKEKGIEELLSAMRKLLAEGIECSLDVVGDNEEDYIGIIQQYENEGWLHYHGYQTDVRPFIENCHCFVLPSWHEGMANTNLECSAMGRPVITSDIHGCKESVIDGVSGYLCKKKDVDSLYQVMKKFTKLSSKERKNMGEAGREHMKNFFDKRRVVEKTIYKLFE